MSLYLSESSDSSVEGSGSMQDSLGHTLMIRVHGRRKEGSILLWIVAERTAEGWPAPLDSAIFKGIRTEADRIEGTVAAGLQWVSGPDKFRLTRSKFPAEGAFVLRRQ